MKRKIVAILSAIALSAGILPAVPAAAVQAADEKQQKELYGITEQAEENHSRAVTFNNVVLKDEFWSAKQKSFICKVIETGIKNVEAYRGGIDNLRNAAMKNGKLEKDADYDQYFRSGEKQDGYEDNLYFLDTDPYKMIEAMSYCLQIDAAGDAQILSQQNRFKEKLNTWIPYIEGAQETYVDTSGNPVDNVSLGQYDGYLDTYFTLDMAKNTRRPAKLINFHLHEMYVFGHFYEAAVAYTRAMQYQDLRLLDVAVRNADMMTRLFGEGKWESYPGHQEIELALIKLALVCEEVGTVDGVNYASRSDDYVKLAKFFLDKRGYDMNHGDFGGAFASDPNYRQTHAPVAEQTTAVGHAVRAMYMYTAMADVETMTGDTTYEAALNAIWKDLQTKTYVTGGIGSSGGGSSSEGFGKSYYLPNDGAYAETCANIGSMMWSQRMNLLYGDASYIDTMETALYNSVISGVNFDGDKFFYQNPMSSTGNKARSGWFGCACCPPNLMRTISSLGGYIYAQDDSSVAVNLYIGNEADITVGGKDIKLALSTDMPWYGTSEMTVQKADKAQFALKLRIPAWATGENTIKVNGTEVACTAQDQVQGYVVIDRVWNTGDQITIDFPMETTKYHSDERVTTNKGLAAVKRGPVVYAAEGKDNGFTTSKAYLGSTFTENIVDNVLTNADTSAEDTYGIKKGMVIKADGKSVDALGNLDDVQWTFIPYYAWNNRGSDTMQVFVNDMDGFDANKLLAKAAAVETVYYNPSFNQEDKINDGDTSTFWCCWKKDEVLTDPWAKYTFADNYNLSACVVNWYDDGAGAQVPKGLVIEYQDAEGNWKEVTPVGTWSTFTKDVDNIYEFEPVTTKAIRMTMKNGGTASVAVREWNLIGEKIETELPEVLADFTFDDEAAGFTSAYAKAEGTYELQEHEGHGNALYLDGTDDFLRVTGTDGSSLLTGAREMTISFQAKPDASGKNWLFYAAPDDSKQTYQKEKYVGILDKSGAVQAERFNNSGARPTSAKTDVPANEWYYLTVVQTKTETIIYVNGEEKVRQSSNYSLIDILEADSIFYIGKANWDSGEYYKGLIDNYKIYSRALDDAEVKALAEQYTGKKPDPVENPYDDVKEGDWFYNEVLFAYENQLMTGKKEQIFAPYENIARAQFAVILYRLEGSPEVTYDGAFGDVPAGEWFSDAITWAGQKGIVTGYTATGDFGPNNPITREELATMMYRYAKYKNYAVDQTAELDKYEDHADIHEFALDAVKWAAGTGIIKGKYEETRIDPMGNTLRGETAIVLERFVKAYQQEKAE